MINRDFILGYGAGKASAGPPVVIESLSVTENGEYTAPTGKAYSPVNVNVPNTYVAADEGKVVSNGALVSQTSTSVTQNGTIDTTLNNSVVVDVPTGGGSAERNDVNFYDYDGTIVASYSAADFANLAAAPANPTHEGLTAQGWNWSLIDAKNYVLFCGMLDIGQMYTTSDGKTRVYIELEEGRLSPYFGLGVNGTCDIDWGDGSTHDTLTGTSLTTNKYVRHTYAAAGAYVITVDPGSDHIGFNKVFLSKWNIATITDTCYNGAVKKVEVGNNAAINSEAFLKCYSLKTIMLPKGLTDIGNSAFNSCYSLRFVSIPKTILTLGTSVFWQCSAMAAISFPPNITTTPNSICSGCISLESVCVPKNATSIGSNSFNSAQSLTSVAMAYGVLSIGKAFGNCLSLMSVTIPASVTELTGAVFYSCKSLGSIKFLSPTPPTITASNAFSGVPYDCIIYVPSGSLAAYTGATNYPSSSTYTYVEY